MWNPYVRANRNYPPSKYERTVPMFDRLRERAKNRDEAKKMLDEFLAEHPEAEQELRDNNIDPASPLLVFLLPFILKFIQAWLDKNKKTAVVADDKGM